ncbi:hypothetical protein [Rhizobium binxianense]|uniref:hypothetical protein n=1 Tax=Rhizobium binxianense TaxID=3024242 RepID=UPI0023623C08|nr:hypothetical protein [Rhizobium sp. MJ37]MDC9835543.1 hypothetical protein [Rhizobium sp. MJ37]
MFVLLLVVAGFALFFWGINYLPGVYAKDRLERAKDLARTAIQVGAYSYPNSLNEPHEQEAFKQRMSSLAIQEGLTPDEADIWVDLPDLLPSIMTMQGVLESRQIDSETASAATDEFARQAAEGWKNLYRGGLGPDRTPLNR